MNIIYPRERGEPSFLSQQEGSVFPVLPPSPTSEGHIDLSPPNFMCSLSSSLSLLYWVWFEGISPTRGHIPEWKPALHKNHQLPKASQLGVGLRSPLLIHAGICMAWSYIGLSCVLNHCELMWATALSYPANTVSRLASTASVSYNLSAAFPVMILEPWWEEVWYSVTFSAEYSQVFYSLHIDQLKLSSVCVCVRARVCLRTVHNAIKLKAQCWLWVTFFWDVDK